MGGVHHRRTTAHVDCSSQHVFEFLPRHAELDQRLDMETNTVVAPGRYGDAQRNQLAGLFVQSTILRARSLGGDN